MGFLFLLNALMKLLLGCVWFWMYFCWIFLLLCFRFRFGMCFVSCYWWKCFDYPLLFVAVLFILKFKSGTKASLGSCLWSGWQHHNPTTINLSNWHSSFNPLFNLVFLYFLLFVGLALFSSWFIFCCSVVLDIRCSNQCWFCSAYWQQEDWR